MENNQSQINPIHIQTMVDSLAQQNQNLSLQLADANGRIAVLEAQLRTLAEQDSPESEPEVEVVN